MSGVNWSDWINWNSIDKPPTLHSNTRIQAVNDEGDTLGEGDWHFTARDCEWSEITAYRYEIEESESDMHPDLEWLAIGLVEWDSDFTHIQKACVGENEYTVLYWKSGGANRYSFYEWLQARKDLGLIMSDEEEEIKAEERPKRNLYEEIKEGFDALESDRTDNVNKPKHYQLREGYEVYDLRQDLAAKAANGGATYDQYSDWDRAIEYIIRMWGKNRLEDAKKGRWYLDKLIEKLEAQE